LPNAPGELHLKEPVLCFGIAQAKPCIALGCCVDVRNCERIAIYLNGRADTTDGSGASRLRHRARHEMKPKRDQSRRQQEDHETEAEEETGQSIVLRC
jgi:hypothetical protein